VGRFAPSPTGELHLGSLYTAAASFLDARVHGGRWLVRMEDVDRSREVRGAADRILATLESFGFEWDGAVMRQSARSEAYDAALAELRGRNLTFQCSCSRSDLAEEARYPGYCRHGPRDPAAVTATRLKVEPGRVAFTDLIQGDYSEDVAHEVGDVILKRRDGLYAYLLAVVVDDAAQDVSHVVRGADLFDNTPRQIYLQRLLGLPTPVYTHVPALLEPDGRKLAKSARSVPLDRDRALPQLAYVFDLMGLAPPASLVRGSLRDAWDWAFAHGNLDAVERRPTRRLALDRP
jgi:glutamyl-Q tRNA(Asp) synthetase